MTRWRIDLQENGASVHVALPVETGIALDAAGFVDVRPVPGSRLWTLTPQSKVGAVAVESVEVHVAPKVPIARVVWLLEHTRTGVTWRDDLVHVEQAADLLTAIVTAYERLATRGLRGGLLQGHRSVEEALTVGRGPIRETDQLRRRFALPLPVEVRYDDYTVDTRRTGCCAPPSPPACACKAEKPSGFPDADLYQISPTARRSSCPSAISSTRRATRRGGFTSYAAPARFCTRTPSTCPCSPRTSAWHWIGSLKRSEWAGQVHRLQAR